MTTETARRAILERIANTRDVIEQARMEGAVARRELQPTTYERLLRLSSRYNQHRAAGRARAAAATKRMALRIVEVME